MSRRPGIGRAWFEKHSSDVYPKDFITYNGKKFNPPKYYDSIFDIDNPQEFAKVKKRRKAEQLKHSDNCTPQRLAVREEVQKIKAKQLIRNLENDS